MADHLISFARRRRAFATHALDRRVLDCCSSYCFKMAACSDTAAASGAGLAGGDGLAVVVVVGRAGRSGADPLSKRFGGS